MGTLGENKAPKFVRKPQLRQEDDGNRLIFECELSGHPQPQVRKNIYQNKQLMHYLKREHKYTKFDSTLLSFRQFFTYLFLM